MKSFLISVFTLASLFTYARPVTPAPTPVKVINKPAPSPSTQLERQPRKMEPQGYWFVEPYVGVDLGIIDTTTTASQPPAGSYSYSANGIALGSRGGYNLASDIFFALDFQLTLGGQLQVSSQPTGANRPTDNFYKMLLNLQAGWKPTQSFQFWGGYFLLNDLTDQASSGNRVFHGDGFRLGAGWSVFQNMTLGFNYDIVTYKKIDGSGSSYNLSNDYSKFNYQVFHFNCSFPFQL